MLNFSEFLRESEKVDLKKLREYTLTHMSSDRFQLKSDDFFKEFTVLPYKSEILDDLKELHSKLADSIESLDVNDLYKNVKAANNIPYNFGNIFTSGFTLSIVPDLVNSLEDSMRDSLNKSEREFLLNHFSQLDKDKKDDIIEALRERAEILCGVIQALFYYIRTEDKENYYQGMNSEEILEEYEEAIEEASRGLFSYRGPFSNSTSETKFSNENIAFWAAKKDMKELLIQGTVEPKLIYTEDKMSDVPGLKLSLLSKGEETPKKEYSHFPLVELKRKIEEFYNKEF